MRIYVPPSNDYGSTTPRSFALGGGGAGKGTAWRKFLQAADGGPVPGPWAAPQGARRTGQKKLFWIALGLMALCALLVVVKRGGGPGFDADHGVKEASEFADWGNEGGGAVVSYADRQEVVMTSVAGAREGQARVEDEGLSWKA